MKSHKNILISGLCLMFGALQASQAPQQADTNKNRILTEVLLPKFTEQTMMEELLNGTNDEAKGFLANISDASMKNRFARQSDGKILGLYPIQNNAFGIIRWNPDNSVDTTFGENGHQYIVFKERPYADRAIISQPDNKIIVAGASKKLFYLARLSADGKQLDQTFGQNGTIEWPITIEQQPIEPLEVHCMTSLNDGRFFLVCSKEHDTKFYVVGFTNDGSLLTDEKFAGGKGFAVIESPFSIQAVRLIIDEKYNARHIVKAYEKQ